MSDPVKPAWQNVYQKAADELMTVEGHGAVTIRSLAPIIFPLEDDVVAVGRQQPTIGDGDSVCVAREIVNPSVA